MSETGKTTPEFGHSSSKHKSKLKANKSWILFFNTLFLVSHSRLIDAYPEPTGSFALQDQQIDHLNDSVEIISQQIPFDEQENEIDDFAEPRDGLCATAMSEIDNCSQQLIGLSENTYPTNMHDMNEVYCRKFKENTACIKDKAKCFKPFENQVISWVLYNTNKMNVKRCNNENEKGRFLRLTNSCFASMKNQMDNCMHSYIGSVDAIADDPKFRMKSEDESAKAFEFEDIQIQLSCCANRRFKQCIMNKAKQMCKPNESLQKLKRTNSNSSQRSAKKSVVRSMQDTMDDLKKTLNDMCLVGPEFICKKVDENFCRKKFDSAYTNRKPKHKSIVPGMVKIYGDP